MNLSRTTNNYAAKRQMTVNVVPVRDNCPRGFSEVFLTIGPTDSDSDAELTYISSDGMVYAYYSNTWLPNDVKEELPATIENEQQLRNILKYLYGG